MKSTILLVMTLMGMTPYLHAAESVTTSTCSNIWHSAQSSTLPNSKFEQVTISPDGQTIIVADKDRRHFSFLDTTTLEQFAALTSSQDPQIVTTPHGKKITLHFSTRFFNGSAPETFVNLTDDNDQPITFKYNIEAITEKLIVKLSHYANVIQMLTPDDPEIYTLNDGDDRKVNHHTLLAFTPNQQAVVSFGTKQTFIWPLSNKWQAMEEKKPAEVIDCKAKALAFLHGNKFVTLSHKKKRTDELYTSRDTVVTLWEKQ